MAQILTQEEFDALLSGLEGKETKDPVIHSEGDVEATLKGYINKVEGLQVKSKRIPEIVKISAEYIGEMVRELVSTSGELDKIRNSYNKSEQALTDANTALKNIEEKARKTDEVYAKLQGDYRILQGQNRDLVDVNLTLKMAHAQVEIEKTNLEQVARKTGDDYQRLQNKSRNVMDVNSTLRDNYERLEKEKDSLAERLGVQEKGLSGSIKQLEYANRRAKKLVIGGITLAMISFLGGDFTGYHRRGYIESPDTQQYQLKNKEEY